MFNKNIKTAFFGNSEFSLIVLLELKKLGFLPDIVVTTPDKPVGRKMILTPTQTKVWAQDNSIEYIEPVKLKDESFLEKMKEYNLFIVASYGKIIPKALIDIPKYKALNIHPSLLPKYRGPSPLQEQILNNEKNVGVSIMLIDEQMDHGAILAQKKVDLPDRQAGIPSWPVGFNELSEILGKEGAKLLMKILPEWIKGKIKPKEQNHSEATFTKKVEKQDGLIICPDVSHQENVDKNPEVKPRGNETYKDYLKYLAYEDWPGTYFEATHNGKKLKVIVKKAVWKDDELEILRVVPEGKKEMDYKDFLRGLR